MEIIFRILRIILQKGRTPTLIFAFRIIALICSVTDRYVLIIKTRENNKLETEYTIPKVYFEGNMSKMTKKSDEREITVKYTSKNLNFESYVKIKVQGTSSLAYDKKNYDSLKSVDLSVGNDKNYNRFPIYKYSVLTDNKNNLESYMDLYSPVELYSCGKNDKNLPLYGDSIDFLNSIITKKVRKKIIYNKDDCQAYSLNAGWGYLKYLIDELIVCLFIYQSVHSSFCVHPSFF